MPLVEEISTITAKGQTTVPKSVRQALGLGYGGRIAFRVEAGQVSVHAVVRDDAADPALAPFLGLLEADLIARPDAIRPLPAPLAERMAALAAEIGATNPDAPIEGEVGL